MEIPPGRVGEEGVIYDSYAISVHGLKDSFEEEYRLRPCHPSNIGSKVKLRSFEK
jgi:hypothetical protein